MTSIEKSSYWKGCFGAVRRVLDDERELEERLILVDHPWVEEYLHWVVVDDEWVLHGSELPPVRWRGSSTTHRGWCLGGDRVNNRGNNRGNSEL